jgi:uncharacterized protein (DUF1786 family)
VWCATPDAARTLDDDLTRVEEQGVRVVSEDEAARLLAGNDDLVHVEMRDFDGAAIRAALTTFGIDPTVNVVAVAAFDHGAAPPDVSDRRFRFDAIARRVREWPDALAFAYRQEDLPSDLTRLAAVAADAARYGEQAVPVIMMDTGAAALAGALEDPRVREHDESLVANVGNFHTLAFHLSGGRIVALFEHHTGELNREKLEKYLRELGDGIIDNGRVVEDSGHGALVLDSGHAGARQDGQVPFLAVTGPRRELLRGSRLQPYEDVPHGDMMLSGCFGLLRAVAALDPALAGAIEGVLG